MYEISFDPKSSSKYIKKSIKIPSMKIKKFSTFSRTFALVRRKMLLFE